VLSGVIRTEAWADAAYGVWSALSDCRIQVYIPSNPVYDTNTGTYSEGPEDLIYEGTASIQATTLALRDLVDGSDSLTQRFRFQIPRTAPNIDGRMRARVLFGNLQNTDLTGFEFNVTESFNSGGSFEKTFFATVNDGR